MAEMQPTMEILKKIRKNSEQNKDEVFTRLYRYMLRKDLYYLAYQNLYANQGAATKGVNNDTADGFGEEKIKNIIDSLAQETYQPKPARRVYIKKSNGKMRPLGIPTFTDKLVQEVLRMILEAVYEPIFLDCSHGFRPNRSCHTALKSLKNEFTGARWFIEGDITGCFDNIDHGKLVGYIGNKIKDARLIKLIWKMLKAGYLEDWKYNSTYSGTPQGGIISPLFANIYLHELDKFVAQLSKNFFSQPDARRAPEYRAIEHKLYKTSKEIKIATQEERAKLIKKYKLLKKELLKTPCKKQTDKKIKYIRYADDFIMGVNGSKEDCIWIKEKLSDFIACELKMEMSDEKTLITHSSECARFLGFDIRVRRNDSVKRGSKGNVTMRTLNNKTELLIPQKDKIMKFLFDKKVIQQRKSGEIVPVSRAALLRCTELEIVSQYNAELRGICNYYSIAGNYNILNYFSYLMEYSCLKTLAHKLRSNCGKVKVKYKDGNGKWGIPYETKTGKKRCYLAKHSDCRNVTIASDNLPNTSKMLHGYIGTTLESRLSAKVCELCGTSEAEYYEIHHVNKVKNLKGKALWEKVMIAKRRKTIVLCKSCHDKIHNRSSHND